VTKRKKDDVSEETSKKTNGGMSKKTKPYERGKAIWKGTSGSKNGMKEKDIVEKNASAHRLGRRHFVGVSA